MTRWALAVAFLTVIGCASARAGRQVTRAQLAFAHELEQRRNWSSLMQTIERMHRQGKRSAETLTLRAAAFRGEGVSGEAEVDLRAALKLDSKYAPAHAALAAILDTQGKAEEADRHHRRALDIDPDNPEYLNNLGFSLYMHGRAKEAIEILRRAADLAPMVRRYRNNLGFAYARAGDFARAEQQFALGAPPAEARNNLGFAYEVTGNLPQAFDAYVEAIRLDPALERARVNLAFVARRLARSLPAGLSAPAEDGRTQ